MDDIEGIEGIQSMRKQKASGPELETFLDEDPKAHK